jgi:transcriptional regulator with XRE-family HTH domain
MKMQERELARKIRKEQGLALNEIAKIVGVAKSSVSAWVRDIQLTTEQQQVLLSRNPIFNRQASGAKKWIEHNQNIRKQYQENGKIMARESCNNNLFNIGCALYWAEGTKNRNDARLSNTDPSLLKIWLRFLKEIFLIQDTKIAIAIQCYLNNGISQTDIENYWLKTLDLPSSCLRKTGIVTKHPMSKFYKKHKHLYGVCMISVYSTELVQTIYGAIQELSGEEKPQWLDCNLPLELKGKSESFRGSGCGFESY